MCHKIVAGATPDDAGRRALMLAIALARPLGAGIVLAGVAHPLGVAPRDDRELAELLDGLDELREEAPHDVPVSIDAVRAASAASGLDELAARHAASVLVLGPPHRGPVARALRGDVAEGALTGAPCAVAVATPETTADAPRRIGVGWDGSPEACEALEWAVQLAERTAGRVVLLHVGDRQPAERADGRAISDVAREARERVPAHARLLWGDAGIALVHASGTLDLLVVGSRGRGPLRRALLGSVSDRVLREARCPVVVLPRGILARAEALPG